MLIRITVVLASANPVIDDRMSGESRPSVNTIQPGFELLKLLAKLSVNSAAFRHSLADVVLVNALGEAT